MGEITREMKESIGQIYLMLIYTTGIYEKLSRTSMLTSLITAALKKKGNWETFGKQIEGCRTNLKAAAQHAATQTGWPIADQMLQDIMDVLTTIAYCEDLIMLKKGDFHDPAHLLGGSCVEG